MGFYAQKSALVQELDLMQHIVERKSTIPILSNVLLEFEKFELRLSVTDLELGARCACVAKVKTPGVVTVPARRLLEIVRSLPDTEVRFKVLENNWLQVTCEQSAFKLVGMAKDNFPALPEAPKSQAKVPAGILRNLVERTIFAVSTEENRSSLNGALLVVNPTAQLLPQRTATAWRLPSIAARSLASPAKCGCWFPTRR